MKKLILVTAISSIALMSGCASNTEQTGSVQNDYSAELNARNKEINILKQQLTASQKEAVAANMAAQSVSSSSSSSSMTGDNLPPNAKSGQCFARVYTPPVYTAGTEKVLKAEGYDVVKIIPAVYGSEEQTVLLQEATEVLDIIPATYETREERVLVSPAITELRRVPAVYGYTEEKLLVKPAHTIWKKGSGPITKVNESTGEIMCLVEVPAEYRTVKTRVLKTPESTKNVVVKDAVYKTVKSRVTAKPARTVAREIPAKYGTVTVKTLVKEASSSSVKVPAVYETVRTSVKASEGVMKWAPILCKTNVTGDIIRQIQSSLNAKKYRAGPVDGVYGAQTTSAVRKYQSDKSMAGNGQLTIKLVDSLGIKY